MFKKKSNESTPKEKKPFYKRWWFILLAVCFLFVLVVSPFLPNEPLHIYDNARDVDCHTGMGEVNGKLSLIEVKSKECTKKALTDWYNNYVIKNKDDYNYFIIKYTDKDDMGVYAINGIVQKDVHLEVFNEYDEEYCLGSSEGSTVYLIENGKLKKVFEE